MCKLGNHAGCGVGLKSSIGFVMDVSKYIHINIKLYIVRLECFGEDQSTCVKLYLGRVSAWSSFRTICIYRT